MRENMLNIASEIVSNRITVNGYHFFGHQIQNLVIIKCYILLTSKIKIFFSICNNSFFITPQNCLICSAARSRPVFSFVATLSLKAFVILILFYYLFYWIIKDQELWQHFKITDGVFIWGTIYFYFLNNLLILVTDCKY